MIIYLYICHIAIQYFILIAYCHSELEVFKLIFMHIILVLNNFLLGLWCLIFNNDTDVLVPSI